MLIRIRKRAVLKEATVEKQEEARERQKGYEHKYRRVHRDVLRFKQDVRRSL